MNVLITGGTGLIGTHLTDLLLKNGHVVSHLSRNKKENQGSVKVFHWDLSQKEINKKAFDGVDCIVHLAGEGIVDKRWSAKRKKEIISSRTESLQLIHQTLKEISHTVKVLVSASGIGYYGADRKEEILDENSLPGSDFVSQCCVAWENEALKFESLGIRSVIVRTGIVLSNQGGALMKMIPPIKYFLGAPIGTGEQWQSWIHIDDLCSLMFRCILVETYEGIYNGVAPEPVTNQVLTKNIAKVLSRPLWLPNVPSWVLTLLFGEMSVLLLGSTFVRNSRIEQGEKFVFKYPQCHEALREILGR